MIKKILIILSCFAICLTLTSCDTGFGSLKYVEANDSDIPVESVIAQNSNYILELDKDNMGIVLTDVKTNEKWSSTPINDSDEPELDEFGMPINKHPRVESILAVECKNFESDEVNTYFSYTDAVQGGYVTHEVIENGILLKYHFADASVMIPLECTLTDNGVKLSIDPKKIEENENKVISLSIAPFFCGVKNDTENSYLFVPSGSGALVGTQTKSEQGNSFSAQIYGNDPSIDEVASTSTTEVMRLNVFGAKAGDKAVCAIVDGSPASARIDVTSGSKSFGYSSCYASFLMRGYTNHVAELYSYERVENVVYSKKMINKPVSVTFCPLSGDNADYSGMAAVYRDYLIANNGMKTVDKDVSLSVRIIGGTQMTESFVGIPYETIYPTTTLTAAENIINDIKKNLGDGFAVQLKGFGESGIDIGKIAGNYTVSDKLGSMSKLEKLFNSYKDNNIDLYFDFDIVKFNTNSSGLSKFFDSATNAGGQKALQYYYDIAVRDKKIDTAYNLLSPAKFSDIYNKLSKKISKYNISGVSFDTLSSIAYSDYIDNENADYYSKNGYANAAGSVIDALKTNKNQYMASSANAYSAIKADIITESPISSEKNNAFLYDVPFYQMVFKGSIPITVQSVNLTSDSKLAVLKAVESGSGLGYTLIDTWDSSMINSDLPYFYNSVYSEIKEGMFENSKSLSDYYKKISGQQIIKHFVHENGLRETLFENGVRVYVNYTNSKLETPAGELPPYEYFITE
ncbi:MAG: hypothetical protein J6B22_05965 [Clostridia bacterium]|nr:hypothetical protein [Clostridia bacterium]